MIMDGINIYSGAEPVFMEENVFKTIIPLTTQADEEILRLLEFCVVPRTRSVIQEFMKLSNREHFRKNILNPLIKGGLLKLTRPDKPTSPKQKYYA